MVKKILNVVLFAGVFGVIGFSFNSCAPTAPSETSATTLISAPSSLALTSAALSGSSAIALSCGCPFNLSVMGYGDTSIIHFSFAERLDTLISTHHLNANIIPPSPAVGDTVSSWIALATPHDSVSPSNRGTLLYDTVRVTAIH
ncbi:MAG TPA: hypothetical protein VFX22_02850 [Candidatus Kapabacteria bacterium]|nr:hypothetical protein [Candidatus Kapabacteria bacterium]